LTKKVGVLCVFVRRPRGEEFNINTNGVLDLVFSLFK
jgi:hypothetical protein